MSPTNQYLAESYKPDTGATATKKRSNAATRLEPHEKEKANADSDELQDTRVRFAMIFTGGSSTHPDVAAALRDCRRAFGSVALFSGIVNLLMLAGPLYMLQIYDRVLSSRSVPTLVALSIFLVGAYAFQGVLDLIRSRVVVRSAMLLDQRLALAVHGAMIRLSIATRHPGEAPQPIRDLDQIRTFLTGAGPIAVRNSRSLTIPAAL